MGLGISMELHPIIDDCIIIKVHTSIGMGIPHHPGIGISDGIT